MNSATDEHARVDNPAAKRYAPRRSNDIRNLLSILLVVGFFGVLFLILLRGLDLQNNQSGFMLLGTLAAAFGVVMQFHFGSSSGSERKSDLLAASEPPQILKSQKETS